MYFTLYFTHESSFISGNVCYIFPENGGEGVLQGQNMLQFYDSCRKKQVNHNYYLVATNKIVAYFDPGSKTVLFQH